MRSRQHWPHWLAAGQTRRENSEVLSWGENRLLNTLPNAVHCVGVCACAVKDVAPILAGRIESHALFCSVALMKWNTFLSSSCFFSYSIRVPYFFFHSHKHVHFYFHHDQKLVMKKHKNVSLSVAIEWNTDFILHARTEDRSNACYST